MKWFHHECSAKHDPKLQVLGDTFGAEGLGIYWGLLEEIGLHSDTFHLKVSGISAELDQNFDELRQKSVEMDPKHFQGQIDLRQVPELPLKILAKILFTTPRKLRTVLDTCVGLALFDHHKWANFNLLYSPSFEQRADDYTRRMKRRSDTVRTISGQSPNTLRTEFEHSPDNLRTKSEKVLLEQEQNKNRKEEEKNRTDTLPVVHLSTTNPHEGAEERFKLKLTQEEFQKLILGCRRMVALWNSQHPPGFTWDFSESELTKLIHGGNADQKLALCTYACELQGEGITYPDLVLRAVQLMLDSSTKTRITNPFGWLWACLHGSGRNGSSSWAQALTSRQKALLVRQVTYSAPPRSPP